MVVTPTDSPVASTARPSRAPESSAPSAEPTTGPLPIASLDPAMSAAELFAENTDVATLGISERSQETREEAIVRDIRFAGAEGVLVPAYVVRPATGPPRAGVLFLHWLGEFDSNRKEFLDEAVTLAGQGVESILIDQSFPWVNRPDGLEHDRLGIGYQVRDARRAFAILAGDVGDGKLAIVGHDFGGMYAAIVRGLDSRVAAAVLLAPTGAWADWFVRYMHTVESAGEADYRTAMLDLDPVTWLARPGAPVLLQFASFDPFVPQSARETLAAAAGDAAEDRTYDAGHELDLGAAQSERDAWLLEVLGID
jgi:pimeloyl-ACP methyl ester carboxylesterase